MEGQERDDVRKDAESHGQAQTSREPHVPQDHLNEGGQQVDVAWWTWQRVSARQGHLPLDPFKRLIPLALQHCSRNQSHENVEAHPLEAIFSLGGPTKTLFLPKFLPQGGGAWAGMFIV